VEVPLLSNFRMKSVLTAPPPASGGVLLSILNIMEHYKNDTHLETALGSHRLIEAFKHAYGQRGSKVTKILAFFGDPMNDPIFKNISENIRHFVTKGVSDKVFRKINDSKTFPLNYYSPTFSQAEDHGTMHVSVMTASGDAVSLTSTINLGFGSKIMDPKTGIILNDQM
jgi:gamma-glutamyltranspeptidase / glutathione hydrolase / leukotriene-C4 hydrolase